MSALPRSRSKIRALASAAMGPLPVDGAALRYLYRARNLIERFFNKIKRVGGLRRVMISSQ